MESSLPRSSRETSREASPRRGSIKERTEERPIRPLSKAFPLVRSETSPPRATSLARGSSGDHDKAAKGRLQTIPSMPAPPFHPTTPPRDVTPQLRQPSFSSDVDNAGWDPLVTHMWVQFPGDSGPVFGWFREGAAPLLDTFFGSDGGFRNITKDELTQYVLADIQSPRRARPPGGTILHFTLHNQVHEALKSKDFLRDPRNSTSFPIASEKDWQRVALPGSSLSLDFHFPCSACGVIRIVKRSETALVREFPPEYEFHCRDVGLECAVFTTMKVTFLSRASPPRADATSSSPAVVKPPDAHHPSSPSASRVPYDDAWRKRMKFWAGITTYDGSPSLVELRGWQHTLLEAYQEVQVPEGRPQVLQATKYLTGEAEKWWKSVAGQPRGQQLDTFHALCEALERRFIPRSVHQKAIRDWNSLKQTGSAEEYMRRVDELATIQPLGETAEYWHAWEGMRPEIKAEIQFRLEEQGRMTCSRDELWSLMWHAETRYPPKPRTPFPPRFASRKMEVRVANLAAMPATCWVCDTQGHRAHECAKRQATGCARCGSRAHKLIACPQRPDMRKGALTKTTKSPPSREPTRPRK